MKKIQKKYIEYFVIDLSGEETQRPNGFVEAIELRGGKNLGEIGREFLYWRNRVQEITHRQTVDAKAIVVFSRADSAEYMHFPSVLGPVKWTDDQMKELEIQRNADVTVDIDIDLEKEYRSVLEKEEKLAPGMVLFLEKVYSINPGKERVDLRGEIHPFLFLMTLDWFADQARSVYYENTQLI